MFVRFGVENRRACPCARRCTDRRSIVFRNGEEAAAADDAAIQHGGQTEQTTVRERGGVKDICPHLPRGGQHRQGDASGNMHRCFTRLKFCGCAFNTLIVLLTSRKRAAVVQMGRPGTAPGTFFTFTSFEGEHLSNACFQSGCGIS